MDLEEHVFLRTFHRWACLDVAGQQRGVRTGTGLGPMRSLPAVGGRDRLAQALQLCRWVGLAAWRQAPQPPIAHGFSKPAPGRL